MRTLCPRTTSLVQLFDSALPPITRYVREVVGRFVWKRSLRFNLPDLQDGAPSDALTRTNRRDHQPVQFRQTYPDVPFDGCEGVEGT